jgi:hypothetical protein
MAEELDAQEPEVQVPEEKTPTAEQVPQQALFEPRNIAEAMEMPDPEPVAEPEPESEPELPVVEPDWLNAPPPQPPTPDQPVDYPVPPPDYYGHPRQPQAPPARAGDQALEAFVENPEAWFQQRMEQAMSQYGGPIQQNLQSIAFMQHQMMENNIRQAATQADGAIRRAYDSFNQDSTFRSNKAMQEQIGNTLQGMRENALREARAGNFAPLAALQNLSEAEIAGTLAYVRAVAGVGSPGQAPLQVEGATVETSRAPVAEQTVELTAEQEEIARRMGPGYRAKLVASLKEQQKHDDLEW